VLSIFGAWTNIIEGAYLYIWILGVLGCYYESLVVVRQWVCRCT